MSGYGLGKDVVQMQQQLIRIETAVSRLLVEQRKIMANIQQLNEKVGELEQALDTEHQQIMDALKELQQANADLQQLVVDGGTHEEREALAERINGVITNLSGIIEDVEVEPTPDEI